MEERGGIRASKEGWRTFDQGAEEFKSKMLGAIQSTTNPDQLQAISDELAPYAEARGFEEIWDAFEKKLAGFLEQEFAFKKNVLHARAVKFLDYYECFSYPTPVVRDRVLTKVTSYLMNSATV